MSAGQLIPVDQMQNLSVSKYGTDENFEKIATATAFLPRLQLFGANSGAVKEGKMPMAHWGLVPQKDTYVDLGPTVDVIPISWRPKAMKFSETGTPISFFDPESEEFKKIEQEADNKVQGAVYGHEFLVYVPAAAKFAIYYMCSITSRRQAPEVRALLGKGATLGTVLISNKQYKWHGPTVNVCPNPLEPPNMSDVTRNAESFNNPESSSVEFDPAKMENEEAARPR